MEQIGSPDADVEGKLSAVADPDSCLDTIKNKMVADVLPGKTDAEKLVKDLFNDSNSGVLGSPKLLMSPSFNMETVPVAVATEMVITTSDTQHQQSSALLGAKDISVKGSDPLNEGSDAVLVQEVAYDQTPVVWASLLDGKLHSAEESSENELLNSSRESFVALMPSNTCAMPAHKEMVLIHDHEASIREVTKRERDRIKKRQLRTDANFREREKMQAKERMRNKRSDPLYREQEREKDRIRRRLARQRNLAARDNERQRDRSYKRTQRCFNGNNILTEVEVVDDNYYSVELIGGDTGIELDTSTVVELNTGASVEI